MGAKPRKVPPRGVCPSCGGASTYARGIDCAICAHNLFYGINTPPTMKTIEHFILETVSESATCGASERYFLDCEAPMNKVAEWKIRINSLSQLGLVRLEKNSGDKDWTIFPTPRGEAVLAEIAAEWKADQFSALGLSPPSKI